MVEKACRKCRLIVEGEVCPNCGEAGDLTKNWQGYIYVSNPDSDVARQIVAKTPGKYALKMK